MLEELEPGELDLLRVSVLSADPLARGGLAAMLAGSAVVVGEDALADAVVWDLGPDPDRAPPVRFRADRPVLALAPDAEAAREALDAGASGALDREISAVRLLAALEALRCDLVVIDDRFAAQVLPALPLPPPDESLTPREVQVLGLLAEGLGDRAIGQRLGISAHTARFHARAVREKLGARTRAEAVARAARAHLLEA